MFESLNYPNALAQRVSQVFASIPLGARLLLFAIAGGIVGLGGFTFSYAEGGAYFSDDPKSCANCHVMREVYDRWSRGSHRSVAACNDCHTPHSSLVEKYIVKGINGWNHSAAFTLGNFPDTIRIKPFNLDVARENCRYCHANLVSQISHLADAHPTDCLACHAGIGHGRQ
jgi:cytochrome c nitrite reductase small subunit